MKIYTRTGDSGKTSLFSGERVEKNSLRVCAYGTVDELNSVLGLASAFCRNSRVGEILSRLQNTLFTAGADLATPIDSRRQVERIQQKDWKQLEAMIDELEAALPPIRNFILPGGSQGAAFLHLARTVCRRAERELVTVIQQESQVNTELLIYLNRLSDFLFVLARYENIQEGGEDVLWKGGN